MSDEADDEMRLCERCGKRPYHAALVINWRLGMGGEDTDSLFAYVCRRCAVFFFDKWDALVESECAPKDEP